MGKMANEVGKLILGIVLVGSFMFGSDRVMAQQYQFEPCVTNNIKYCSECRDESKRDFARCGEIDYRGVNLLFK